MRWIAVANATGHGFDRERTLAASNAALLDSRIVQGRMLLARKNSSFERLLAVRSSALRWRNR